jgi:hypothetical protein
MTHDDPFIIQPKIVRYRTYTFEIHAPTRQGDRWHVIIWSPSNAPPITMPGRVTWEEAVKDAEAIVNHIRDGGPAPKL